MSMLVVRNISGNTSVKAVIFISRYLDTHHQVLIFISIVPFRDSVLTKLLKNALGGNSKTFMVRRIYLLQVILVGWLTDEWTDRQTD